MLLDSARVVANELISMPHDVGRTAVIDTQLLARHAPIEVLRQVDDVIWGAPSKPIDRLIIISGHHKIALYRDHFDELKVQFIDVLEFVHHDFLIPSLYS